MKIDEFTEAAEKIVDEEVDPRFVRDLNRGIVVMPEGQEEGEYYVMGEYVVDEFGSHIALYYGSFAASLKGEPKSVWMEEIRETIRHEIQHHVEDLAGCEDLAREEEERDRKDKVDDRGILHSLLRFFGLKS